MNWESAAPAGTDEKSESYLAHELYIARASDSEVRVEAAVVSGSSNVSAHVGSRLGKVGMIERVEERGAEFKRKPFREVERALQGNIPGNQARSDDRIARTSAERPRRRIGKRRYIHVRL